MYITKSLFVEFCSSPKRARWHVNDTNTYQMIQEAQYGGMDGVTIGEDVETMVLARYTDQTIATIDTDDMRSDWHQTYHDRTLQALSSHPDIVYQPGVLFDDVFVKCDLLARQASWAYELIEVKAKNCIRKKTTAAPLLDELVADISIQHRVLSNVLWKQYAWSCSLAYLNKAYSKHGTIDPQAIIIQENVSWELMEDAAIETILQRMRAVLSLSQEAFDELYPYDGTDYLTYYGKPAPKSSLRLIRWCSAKKKLELLEKDKILIEDLDDYDIACLRNEDGESSSASRYVELRKQWEEVVDRQAIQQTLDQLQFPLYFYDYETISRPIPMFEKTAPRQQVVVQYSLHKMDADGSIIHRAWLLDPWATDNRWLLEQMIEHMDGVEQGRRIVWNQWFENGRNVERSHLYPEFTDYLLRINEQTFDLMELFRQQVYFHRAFEWSASIKKVLPVLTDLSYAGLPVSNGAVASTLLRKMIVGELEANLLEPTRRDLLEYCKQDTWAMVQIYEKIRERR